MKKSEVAIAANSVKARWLTLYGLLIPATLIMGVDRAVLAVTAPAIQEAYSLTLSDIGWLLSVFFWAYALMQIPSGYFVQRVGARWAMFAAIIIWSTMTGMTTYATGFAMLLVVRAILGIGQAADWPAAIVSVNKLFTASQRPVANSLLLCALYGGPIIGAPLTGYLLISIGLHGTFVVCGTTAAIFAFVWLIFFREDKTQAIHSPSEEKKTESVEQILLPMLRSHATWAVAFAYACTGYLVAFYQSWLPVYFAKGRSQSTELMSIFTGISAGALCVGVISAGYVIALITKKMSLPLRARVWIASLALLTAAAASCAVPLSSVDIIALLCACVSLMAIGYAQVATWSAVQDIGGQNTGVLTGFVSMFGNFAAGFAPIISASLVKVTGEWSSSFLVVGAVGLTGSLLWVFVGRLSRKQLPAVGVVIVAKDKTCA